MQYFAKEKKPKYYDRSTLSKSQSCKLIRICQKCTEELIYISELFNRRNFLNSKNYIITNSDKMEQISITK